MRKITFRLRIDPENYFVRLLLEKIAKIEHEDGADARPGHVALLDRNSLSKGAGLWFNQAWAKYLVIIATGSFLPVEVYSCIHLFTWDRLALLVINIIVLLYVIRVVWGQKPPPATPVPPAPPPDERTQA